MYILHYSLGFPPARRGGMTAYCMDLMDAQAEKGDEVALLWPGPLKNKNERCAIVVGRQHTLRSGKLCDSFSIDNPLPVTLVDGILDPSWQLISKSKTPFERFFDMHPFDVLHVHTLMGLPVELVVAAKNHGIPVVFTSHDYFPICGRLVLYRGGNVCSSGNDFKACCACNSGGLSVSKIRLIQSPAYGLIKESKLAKLLRARHNSRFEDQSTNLTRTCDYSKSLLYKEIRDRNVCLLNDFDCIFYNSELTKRVYEHYGVSNSHSTVLHVTNINIADFRSPLSVGNNVRFGYLGGFTSHKGFGLLLEACDRLWDSGIRNFRLSIFGDGDINRPYVECFPPFKSGDFAQAADHFDVAVVPSKWYETFGFVTSESLSYGKPVIVTNHVGASDLVRDGVNGRVVAPEVSELADALEELVVNRSIIEEFNAWICANEPPICMAEHERQIKGAYQSVIGQL